MSIRAPLYRSLISDDAAERRSGLFQVLLILDDRIAQFETLRRQLEMAVEQLDRTAKRKSSRHVPEAASCENNKALRLSRRNEEKSTIEASLTALVAGSE